MTYQTEDEDLFDGEHSELAEAIVEVRRELAEARRELAVLKKRIEEIGASYLP
jgi:DNA gyrase/topoisomerase IV subunit A